MTDKDQAIRAALHDADKKGRLIVVSAVTGISEPELRRIMKSTAPLSLMERASLGVHLA